MDILFGLVWVLGIALAIAWICLPFALFGIKPLLRQLHQDNERIIGQLQVIADQLEAAPAPNEGAPPS